MLTEEEKQKLTNLTDKMTLLGLRLNWLGNSPLMAFMKTESIWNALDKHVNLMEKFITEYKQLRLKEAMA